MLLRLGRDCMHYTSLTGNDSKAQNFVKLRFRRKFNAKRRKDIRLKKRHKSIKRKFLVTNPGYGKVIYATDILQSHGNDVLRIHIVCFRINALKNTDISYS